MGYRSLDLAVGVVVLLGSMILFAILFFAIPGLSFLAIFSAAPIAIFNMVWWNKWGIRLCAYRLFYRTFGPHCLVTASATFNIDQNEPSDVIAKVAPTILKWDASSKTLTQVPNRIVLQGKYTLTVTVQSYNEPYDDAEEILEDESTHHLSIHLSGFGGKLTEADSFIGDKIAPLFEVIGNENAKQPMLPSSINVEIEKGNPFLMFYLRDVPLESIDAFELSNSESGNGTKTDVVLTAKRISVSSTSLTTLVETTKRYLASPALSD